ncbi:zinc ribbon domain-containing protein [Terriglobus sp.]|uniref:zinc ribbon domain-containing protein n=1 Tax=Terriglobus sp. TaxID=1889013 RepID=UPI003B00DB5F
MALMFCPACGKEVSDTAPTCPHCGHVVRDGGSRLGRAVKWLLIFGGGAALCFAVLALIGSETSSKPPLVGDSGSAVVKIQDPPPPPPAAKFVVLEHSQRDDECTEVGDYCIRVHCTFYNDGNAAGLRSIGAQLLDGTESVAIRESSLTLLPAGRQQLYFDFKEAELDGNHRYHSQCVAADEP